MEKKRAWPAKGHEVPLLPHAQSLQAVQVFASSQPPISALFYHHSPRSNYTRIRNPPEQRHLHTIWAHLLDELVSIADPSSHPMNRAPVQSRIRAGFDPSECNKVTWSSHIPFSLACYQKAAENSSFSQKWITVEFSKSGKTKFNSLESTENKDEFSRSNWTLKFPDWNSGSVWSLRKRMKINRTFQSQINHIFSLADAWYFHFPETKTREYRTQKPGFFSNQIEGMQIWNQKLIRHWPNS